MLHGVGTVNLVAEDFPAAVRWYTDVLETEPYFEVEGYAELRIGEFQQELGIVAAEQAAVSPADGPAGVVIYWHVDDVRESISDLLDRGAQLLEPMTDRGNGFVTAAVVDPFGNVLGLSRNPHYVEVVAEGPSTDG